MKIVLFVLAAVFTTVLGFPAHPDAGEQEIPLTRIVREANPEPGHFGGFGGFGIGGFHGYGGGYPYGGYGGYGGGLSHSSAHSGAISSPFGSASFASAKAGSFGYGR